MNRKLKLLGVSALSAGFFYLSNLGFNIGIYQNREFESGGYHSVSRIDGAFSHTEVSEYQERGFKFDRVEQFRLPFGTTFLSDDGLESHDGLVDSIKVVGVDPKDLERKRDYLQHRQEFDDADKVFAEQRKRFAGFFNSHQ